MDAIALMFENTEECSKAQKYLISKGITWNNGMGVQRLLEATSGALIIRKSIMIGKINLKYASDRDCIMTHRHEYEIVNYSDKIIWKQLVDDMKLAYIRKQMNKKIKVVQRG